MISIATLAKNIQDSLNANDHGLTFEVFYDAGTFKESVKTRTSKIRYINCLLTINSSATVPIQGTIVASLNTTLTILAPLPHDPEKVKESVATYRDVLDDCFTGSSVQILTDNDKAYTVAITYAPADTGTFEIRPGIGSSLDFIVHIEYGYVENGLNSSDIEFTLDGNAIPYMSVTTSKMPTTETNAYSDASGKGGSRNSSFIHAFEFEMPTLANNAVSDTITNALFSDSMNGVHTLTVKANKNAEPVTYKVILGNINLNLEGVDNGKLTFSLIERANFVGEK